MLFLPSSFAYHETVVVYLTWACITFCLLGNTSSHVMRNCNSLSEIKCLILQLLNKIFTSVKKTS